ncbi:MAG: serine/threonine protein kinase, partial [Gemmatimonadales bacterium]|nr:serine/threonine protein kinase [Gemmatimonadales bacterium]NIP06181.1 serine/threonine protein kinase [Gemmatimonadales bacterium]
MDNSSPTTGWGLQPNRELDGFLIQERIGLGGMGEVYKAVQLSLDRVVVVKVLPRTFAERPLFVKRFHEESSAL